MNGRVRNGRFGVETIPARTLGSIRPELDGDHYMCVRCGVIKETTPKRKRPNMMCKDCILVERTVAKIEAGELTIDDEEEDSCLAVA